MRVLLVAYTHLSRDPRVKSYARNLARAGIDHEIWALEEPRADEPTPANVRRFSTKYQGSSAARYVLSYLAFFLRAFARALRRPRAFSVIHVHNMPNFLVFAFALNKLLGARIVLDNHDVMPVVLTAKRDLPESHWAVRAMLLEQRLSGRFADRILTADHGQRDYLIEHGARPEKIAVRLNLPDPELFPPLPPRAPDGRFRLVYHGTVTHRLGIDLAVRAIDRARAEDPDVRLHVIGAGDGLPAVEGLVRERGLETVVELSRGFVPFEQLPARLAAMDAGLVPNRSTTATDRYMLPVKLLEYVQLGKPVIAPDLSIIRRYFSPTMVHFYRAGDEADMCRAILDLARSPARREALAAEARRFYEAHGFEAQREAYLDLLRELVGRSAVVQRAAAADARPETE